VWLLDGASISHAPRGGNKALRVAAASAVAHNQACARGARRHPMKKETTKDRKVLAKNRKALHDFHVEERHEAGIALTGTEVKSLREGRLNLRDSYARFHEGELWLEGVHISPYPAAGLMNHEPLRRRKLLMHRRELSRLHGKVTERGFTLVPLSFYLKEGIVKVELALVRGKRQYDKREAERRKTAEREAEQAMRDRRR
jgi:SsrA-binding protein